MSIQKIKLKNGNVRYKVRRYSSGRGSKQITKHFKRLCDAQDFLKEMDKQKQNLSLHGISLEVLESMTFEKEALHWFEKRRNEFSPAYQLLIQSFFKEALSDLGECKIRDLRPPRLVEYREKLIAKGLSFASVNKKLNIVLAVLNFSVKQQRFPFNPAVGYEKLRENKDKFSFWEEQEAKTFLELMDVKYPVSSSERWIYLVYLLALNTGLRAGEIWGLMPRDLIQQGELLYVGRQFDKVSLSLRQTKGRRPRRVPCNPVLRGEIESWVQRQNLSKDKTLFQNENGQPIHHDWFAKKVWPKDLKQSGLRRIRFHDLRHTAGTLMVARGIDLVTVKEILGHRDIKTTMNYVHLLGESIKKVARTYALAPTTVRVEPACEVSNVIAFRKT